MIPVTLICTRNLNFLQRSYKNQNLTVNYWQFETFSKKFLNEKTGLLERNNLMPKLSVN